MERWPARARDPGRAAAGGLRVRARAAAVRPARQERGVLRRPRFDPGRHRPLRAGGDLRARASAAGRGTGRRRRQRERRDRAAPRLHRLPRRGLRRPGAEARGRGRDDLADRGGRPDRRRDRRAGLALAPGSLLPDRAGRGAGPFPRPLPAAIADLEARHLQRHGPGGRDPHAPTPKLVIASGTAEAAAIRTRATTPIVFLLFDEFPVIDLQQADGGIDAKRFPNFARLAGSSTWYRNTTTVSASTTVAVPAILSGLKPKKGALPIFRDHPNNLFTLLGHRYRMAVHESQTRLCPQSLCKQEQTRTGSRLSSLYSDVRVVYLHLIAPPALEQRLPVIDESWGNFVGGSTDEEAPGSTGAPKVDLNTFYLSRLRDFNRFVASFKRPGNGPPTLYFLHELLPHTPWLYFPDGRVRAVTSTNAPGRNGELWVNGQLATQAWQRHLLQVGYTDKLLGKFIARLRRVGLWDKALVIVTPDHGISLRGGDLRRRPTHKNLAELGFTPLFVKYPGEQEGKVVDSRHVSTLDILPTIADVLGIKIPWRVDGTSALSGGSGSSVVDVAGVRESYTAALAQRRASLARQLALFGSGDWGRQFAGTGPYRALVGKEVSSFAVATAPAGAAKVDPVGSRLLRRFPRPSALVPSPLAGTLSSVRPGAPLALGLNGRIAAVSVAYRNPGGGPVRFSALAGEHAFRTGRNAVRLFVLGGSPSRPTLQAVATSLSR